MGMQQDESSIVMILGRLWTRRCLDGTIGGTCCTPQARRNTTSSIANIAAHDRP